ncbi:lipase family protein [Phanerochaete sordida]|uniref:Lipase family protein n=1 Tax=Phanerochaete sordida TaxID=48140 RepID=A0A9P3G3E0_9APHY|nr:lipase family protein [Phanerochaete sordida]
MTSGHWAEELKRDIRRKRLELLKARGPLGGGSAQTEGWKRPWRELSYYHWMETWSKKAEAQIRVGIATGACGTGTINWNIVLYTWMESAATYLRDWPTVLKAATAARMGHEADAMKLLEWSDEEIQNIAALWSPDMHYVTICDLTQDAPESDPTLDGPFCGAFFSSDPKNPFIGLVFKGTHVESWQELLVDLHYAPVHAQDGHVWDTHVSHGVYSTLFGPFSKLDGQTPFEYIKNIACTLISERIQASTDVPVRLHLTGHSLGASYAALYFAELLRLFDNGPISSQSGKPACILRDLYTFGSPRFGLLDFVDVFSLAIDEHDGYSWRINCSQDPVCLVPPVLITDARFIHLDKAYEVSQSDGPLELASERNSHPRPPLPVVPINMSNHTPWAYFNALYNTATHTA